MAITQFPRKSGVLKSFTSLVLLLPLISETSLQAGMLENYLRLPDSTYQWKRTEQKSFDNGKVVHLEMVSQTWRGHFWSHHLRVFCPKTIRNSGIAFLFITGDGDGSRDIEMLRTLGSRAGALAAVLTKVPNQPLYDGLHEDALISYTFDKYLRTGDETWPLLFPMVKAAVRAMDTLQTFAEQELKIQINSFVVSGASKRGWTTWLTGAADDRVKAIAPIVIDVLNMRAQTKWAERVYGKQSEQIRDYTDRNLIERMDEPPMVALRQAVDPYSYRERYILPKLLLLGTNDPYWTVDSLRHYWPDLPDPKLVFQTPNAGHDLGGGKEAIQTLAAWFQMLADNQPLPKMTWSIQEHSPTVLEVKTSQSAQKFVLWTADSKDRDFRDEKWTSRPLPAGPNDMQAEARIEAPSQGFRAYLIEAELKSPTGHTFKLSTEARVTPDFKPDEEK